MNKINKIIQTQQQNSVQKRKAITFTSQSDSFVKNHSKSEFNNIAARHLALFNGIDIVFSLIDSSNWSNGLDYISPVFDKNWNICEMQVGIFNPADGNYKVSTYTKQEFFNFIKTINQYTSGNSDEQAEFDDYYQKLVRKFDKLEKFN